ncbi:MAG: hypothetical protein WD397_11925 [Wenzhouxiangellaceae bacterium]
MHKSHDRFEIELEREIALERARKAPSEPELAADWSLKQELRGLGAAELPPVVCARARRTIAAEQRAPWFMAVAAVVVAAVVVTLTLQVPKTPRAVTPSASDMAELQLAFETLNATGHRAATLAGRELSESLTVPDLGLSELPYAGYIRPYFERRDRPNRRLPDRS